MTAVPLPNDQIAKTRRTTEPTRTARAVVALIRVYQAARIGHVSPCRFTPTCSHYAVEAVERHGARRGLRLTIRRLGRCRPGGPFGLDPVPQ
jgi:uncharacterized protein